MSVPLFDSFGRTIDFSGYSHKGLYDSPQDDGLRIPRPNLNQDIATLLSRERHRMLISDARYIVSTFPLVGGALEQKADYVNQAGWSPVFRGRDKVWGKAARQALVDAHRAVNVRGDLFSWDVSWRIASITPDIDGGCFCIFGVSESGFPQLQFLEAHRIGTRNFEREVKTGPYRGLRILNGIIYNALGREVAYRVLGATAADDRDISARDMMHVAVPRWFSDGRPFPNVAYSILDWYDVKETRGYQRTKQKVNSALTIVETTPDGKAPPQSASEALRAQQTREIAAGLTPSNKLTGPIYQELAAGLIRYVKSGAGDIKSHADNTPGDGWLRFDERLVQGAMYGMGWRSEMLDLSKLSGAPTRGFQDQINTAIFARWLAIRPFVLRAELYTLARLIERGDVPDHPEWWMWDYTPPAEFTVDGGRSVKADLDNVRAGTDSIPAIIGRFGRTAEEVMREQAEYLQERKAIAAEYGIAESDLGTLAQPGLQLPGEPTAAPTGQ